MSGVSKGIILAGGKGTRLRPLTHITNKHLLPVYDRPMILYAIDTMRRSGIKDLTIVCGRAHAGHFMNFLGSGRAYDVTLSYAIQDTDDGGIADALHCAKDIVGASSVAVILGDNIFSQSFEKEIRSFKEGAHIFFKKVDDPQRFGCPVFNAKDKLVRIEEKPKKPKSEFAQTGFYIFDDAVFDLIETLKPSKRGELELTDLNNLYLKKGKMRHSFVKGQWLDAGTFESLLKASNIIARSR